METDWTKTIADDTFAAQISLDAAMEKEKNLLKTKQLEHKCNLLTEQLILAKQTIAGKKTKMWKGGKRKGGKGGKGKGKGGKGRVKGGKGNATGRKGQKKGGRGKIDMNDKNLH